MDMTLLAAGCAYGVTVVSCLTWIFVSKQRRIPRTTKTVLGVSLRAATLFILAYLIGKGLNLSASTALTVLIACAAVTLTSWGFASLPGLVFFYVIQQWILGWPDKELLVHNTALKSNKQSRKEPDPMVGQNAVALTPLKPGGKIRINDSSDVDAVCETGFLDRGETVTIVRKEAFTYVVRPGTG